MCFINIAFHSSVLFKDALSGLRQFLPTERPLKMMKNVFYFAVKTLFILEILQFYSEFLVMLETDLIRKLR